MGNRLRRPVAKRRPDFRSRRRYRLGEFPHRQDRCRPIAQLVCWSNEVFAERDNENTLNRTKAYGRTAALMPVRPRATTARASATCPNPLKCARMFSLIFESCLVNCRIVQPCSTGSRAWANVYSIHGEPKAKEANGRCGIFRCERDRVGPRRRTPISLRDSRAHVDPSRTSPRSPRSPLPARCSLLPVAQLKRPTTRASATSLPRPIRKAWTRPINLPPPPQARPPLQRASPTQISRLRKPRSR